MNREPVLILIGAAILVAVGVELVPFLDAVEQLVQAVALVGGAALARRRVWPADSVEREREWAAAQARARLSPDE